VREPRGKRCLGARRGAAEGCLDARRGAADRSNFEQNRSRRGRDTPSGTRYLRPDPLTGAVLEICGSHANGTTVAPRALPVAPCGEARIGGLAVSSGYVYYAAGNGLRRMKLDGSEDKELMGAYGVARVAGAYLGSKASEVSSLALRGKACPSITWVSQKELRCSLADPSLAGPRASPLAAGCAAVVTSNGEAAAREPWVQEYREAERGPVSGRPSTRVEGVS